MGFMWKACKCGCVQGAQGVSLAGVHGSAGVNVRHCVCTLYGRSGPCARQQETVCEVWDVQIYVCVRVPVWDLGTVVTLRGPDTHICWGGACTREGLCACV